MRIRAALIGAVVAIGLSMSGQAPAAADTTTCTGGSGNASGSRQCVPDPATLQALEQRLGADVASALVTQQRLVQSIDNAAATEATLSAEITADEAQVADLQNQIQQLNTQIAVLEAKITVEKAQLSSLARAMYERPSSLLDIIASSGSISDALDRTVQTMIAGVRAKALEDQLQSDLAQAQSDLDARQSDLDAENATLDQVRAGLAQVSGVQTELNSLAAQAVTLIAQIRAAAANAGQIPPDVTANLAALLETQEQNLAAQQEAAAWAQASVGSGYLADQNLLPTGTGPAAGGIPLAWPMRGGVVTQPFGPTGFVLEPPLGPYPHFHTGIDIAAPEGTPVLAAAPGVVIVVGHSAVGYGNYVIVAHGYGVLTLYGHLLETDVYDGQYVTQGQVVGLEGMTGWATGPHVHFEVRINGQVVNPARFLPPI